MSVNCPKLAKVAICNFSPHFQTLSFTENNHSSHALKIKLKATKLFEWLQKIPPKMASQKVEICLKKTPEHKYENRNNNRWIM